MSQDSLKAFSLDDLVAQVRRSAPFYQRLYEALPAKVSLADLPVIDPDAYWQAHARDRREVLTEPHLDGFVLNSSGTSGVPKFSYSTVDEWNAAVATFGTVVSMKRACATATAWRRCLPRATFTRRCCSPRNRSSRSGPGSSSFRLDIRSLSLKSPGSSRLSTSTSWRDSRRISSVWSTRSTPTKPDAVRLEHIIYAGELFTPDQQQSLQARYPGLQIHSAGYASVEGGPIGYADAELHRERTPGL